MFADPHSDCFYALMRKESVSKSQIAGEPQQYTEDTSRETEQCFVKVLSIDSDKSSRWTYIFH